MIDDADDDDDDDKVSQVVGKLNDEASSICKPSIGDSGGEEKFRQGPGLCPRGVVNRMMKQADLTSEMPPGATETSRLMSGFVGAGVVPSRCSRPGQKVAKSKTIVYI
jgi:hypothetical protein